MKITIQYNLPEEKSDYDLAYYGQVNYMAIEEIRSFLRRELRYGSELTKEELIEKLFQYLPEQLE